MNKPIRRHESLQFLSREHHQGLLLSWKIRKGISARIATGRLKNYVSWFFIEHLVPHFQVEELHVFPVLGNNHPLVMQALAEHRNLERLFKSELSALVTFEEIADALEQHIRFEERTLFNEIEKIVTPAQLNSIQTLHAEAPFCENETDKFWL
ncbi:MAG: hemerythrin domain-containing protein [Bacteroidota bacterium]|nr:hemerythrin domain-containing protein [Bacteroidota bacterium]